MSSNGGIIFVKQGAFTINTKITIPAAKHGVIIVFENPYTSWTYTGTDACLEVGGTGTQTIGFELRNGKIECNSATGTPVCLRLKNVNHCKLYNPRLNGSLTNTTTGIELNGGGNFDGDIQIYGPYIHNTKKAITVTNGAANAIEIFGGAIVGTAGPVSGSFGIDKDGGDTWAVYGLDIENMETALREQTIDAPSGSSVFNMRVEGCTNYVTTATSNNTYSGSTTSSIITDTGSNNDFLAPTIETYKRSKTYSSTTIKKDATPLLTVFRPNSTTTTPSTLNFDLWNSSSAQYTALAIRAFATTNTAGSETTNVNMYQRIAGVERAFLGIGNTGLLLCGGQNLRVALSESGLTDFRTFTFPDATGTVATIAATQTLTNKTVDAKLNTFSNIFVFPSQGRTAAFMPTSATTATTGLWGQTIAATVVLTGTTTGMSRDSTGVSLGYSSGTTINSLSGTRISALLTERDYNPITQWQIKLGQTTLCRCFMLLIGTTNAPTSGADPLSGQHGVGFGYDSGVDGNWHIYQNNATGTDSTTIANILTADTLAHTFAIKAVEASSKFQYSIDGAAFADINTKIPGATNGLCWSWWIECLVGSAAKTFQLYYVQHFQDK